MITIVAFMDSRPNSVAYQKFTNVDDAVAFYKRMLERVDVNTISTRKVR